MSKRSKIWILAAAGLVFAQALASLVLPHNFALIAVSDITQCLLLASGALSLLPNALATRGRIRLFWALMTLGLGFWLSYQLFWTYFEVLLRREVPNPFVGDVVLFLHLVPMMAALALQPHVEQDDRTTRLGSLDFVLLLVWWVFLYLYAVIPWQYAQVDETLYEHNLNVIYLTEKIAFLSALAVVWWRSQRSWKVVYAHWFGASLTYAVSSYVANWAIEHQVYFSGSLYDVPLAASMAWVTAIGVMARGGSPKQRPADRASRNAVWVARLGMAAIFSLPLFAAYSVFDHGVPPKVRSFRLVLTLGGMLVMGALVFLKQHLLDRELLGLLSASQESFEDLRRLQVQLVQSEKLASLGQLVGGAAHELNNPLTAMLGYSDLLSATALTGDQRQWADKIGHQVRRTKSLISNLLSFAKQVPTEKILLDINSLVQTALKLSQPQLQARSIRAHTHLTGGLPQIPGDSNQLLQVCLHIINNAFDAMAGAGGVLTVCTRQQDSNVVLEFSDDGPGAEEPDRVFDHVYTARPAGEEAGLGLSACYRIIQEHKGKIMCRNRPERGGTFRIELPVAAQPAAAPSFSPGKASPSNSETQAVAALTLPSTT